MRELYRMIEELIKGSGYPGEIDGREFYNDISAEADEKEDGTYLFVVKKSEEMSYHGCMTITEEQFENRMILRNAMTRNGFVPIDCEWWHFTLKDEPYPDTYFEFPVSSEYLRR